MQFVSGVAKRLQSVAKTRERDGLKLPHEGRVVEPAGEVKAVSLVFRDQPAQFVGRERRRDDVFRPNHDEAPEPAGKNRVLQR